MKFLNPLLFFACLFLVISCYQEDQIPLVADFQYSVVESSYTVPVQIAIDNNTNGAIFYQWTFEGATPSSSDEKQPPALTYTQAGSYVIKLEAWNDFDRSVKEITIQLDSAVELDFDATILINDFAPTTVELTNNTMGASTYEWTFEGGIPATSNEANPGQVLFAEAGDHVIGLRVTNGRESFYSSQSITVKPALQPDFSIVPFFKDEDYEAPLMASLQNQTISGLRYTWSSTGGSITNSSDEHTEIYFASPGEYTVTLQAENDKETQSVEKTIVVKPNSNLLTMNDVKLGVNAAQNTIGCFYSASLRDVLLRDEVSSENGPSIDLVFFAINSSFSYCRFISPDSAADFTFSGIPQASHTYVVNTLESTAIAFTASDFDAMINDGPLSSLDIAANDTGINFFNNSLTPRIVLFQTDDGRKGAIKIKSFVQAGTQSYITLDIKIQKPSGQ